MSAADGPDGDDFPPAMSAQIQSELAAGERLVWAGRAHPHATVGWRMLPISLGCFLPCACLFLLGGALFVGVPLVPQQEHDVWGVYALVMGVVFLGFGVALTAVVLVEYSRVRRTCYALTDRRAIVWRPAQGTTGLEVRSFWPSDLKTVYRIDRGDGSGDVVFQEIDAAVGARPQVVRQGFLGVWHVRHVEELLRRTLLQPPPGSTSQGVFAH
jgi:hypothetical protein